MKTIFNVRVYGILNYNNSILVSDEIHYGMLITKFPGGGLNFGEGTHECVKREFIEEINMPIEIIEHFYTTDFFQPSAFDPAQQVISIYYLIDSKFASEIIGSPEKITLENYGGKTQHFRWIPTEKISDNDFTFPIDKKVAGLIQKHFHGR